MNEPLNIMPDAVADFSTKRCGELVISIMKKVRTLEVGQVLEVRALDTGAPSDISAWCKMTGNELIAGPCGEDGGCYYIRKRQ